MKRRSMWRRYCCAVGAFFIQLSLGNMSSIGNLLPYLSSHMRWKLGPSATVSNLQWVGAAAQMGFGFCSMFSGWVEDAHGTRVTCLLGSLLICYGLLLSYGTVQTSVTLLVLSAGLTVGAGTALTYCPPIYAVVKWFPGREGTLTGIIMSAYFLGYMSSSLLQTFYLNPEFISAGIDGYFTDISLLSKVPSLFIWTAIISVLLQGIGIVLVPEPMFCPEDSYPANLTSSTSSITCRRGSNETTPLLRRVIPHRWTINEDTAPRDLTRNKLFIKYWVTYFLNSVGGVALITTYKTFGETFINDDYFLSIVVSTGAVANGVGAIVWGLASDKFSYKSCMVLITSLLTMFTSTLPLLPYLYSKAAYVIWSLVLFFAMSGYYTVPPTAVKRMFGSKYVTANVGLLLTAQGAGAAVMALGVQNCLMSIGYSGCYLTAASLTFIGLLVTLTIDENPD